MCEADETTDDSTVHCHRRDGVRVGDGCRSAASAESIRRHRDFDERRAERKCGAVGATDAFRRIRAERDERGSCRAGSRHGRQRRFVGGAWYCADLRTGETTQQTTNILVIGKREFDPAWNVFKVIRRGLGEIGESVTLDEERVRFDIRVR